VIGGGPLLEEARGLARHLGAPVEFLGERTDLAAHLREAWAVCLFSEFEGVPFAVQEAMWAGRAVVLSDLPGLLWFAGESAQYVDDVAAAAAAIERLCDYDVALVLGDEAAGRAHRLLTADAPFPQLLSDYRAARR
jgi:glycosyltransferase involved in cell wall biosynthesis